VAQRNAFRKIEIRPYQDTDVDQLVGWSPSSKAPTQISETPSVESHLLPLVRDLGGVEKLHHPDGRDVEIYVVCNLENKARANRRD
jgi:hypothetical protein